MLPDIPLTQARLRRMQAQRLVPALFRPLGADLTITAWHAPGEPVPFAEAVKQKFEPFASGQRWGRAWATTWFHITGSVPRGHRGEELELHVDLGYAGGPGFTCEGMVWLPNGTAVQGLHPSSQTVSLAGRNKIDFYVEAAANPDLMGDRLMRPTPLGAWDSAGDEPLYTLGEVDVVVRETEIAALHYDLDVLDGVLGELADGDPRKHELSVAIAAALDEIDVADLAGTAKAARAELRDVLASPANASAHRIAAVGHAHIDSAWLWPLRETVRKVARTVSNVITLHERYPDLIFAFSSAQQHLWIKEHYPKIFAKLRKAVADGVIVPVGGMWVESDSNMVGAEAMCRQFVQGKRFFLDNYGVETDEVWLPDSFGYAAGLPQIVRQSNTHHFLTQKISWSETNKFPHHSFMWEGIDGSRVFTHFPPADTYNGEIRGKELAYAATNFADKGRTNLSLLPFGYGDGGGGPNRDMMERVARVRDLEGSAKVEVRKPSEFFDEARADYVDAPVWTGELYLELHRGTLTSQAKTKQGNRRNESLLREAELWCTTAAIRTKAPYPYAQLERLWQRLLLHQFHDILPGSSIQWVHLEAEQAHAEMTAELTELISAAQERLAGKGRVPITFNAAGTTRRGVPALGAGVAAEAGPIKITRTVRQVKISNGLVTATVNNKGLLTSVVDHTAVDWNGETVDREVLAGPSNLLQLHPDTPRRWDAWDIDAYYRNKVTDLDDAAEIDEIDGGVRIRRTFGDSTIEQTVTLEAGERRVDFGVDVDWHERERLLKVAFDLDVQAERSAAETQFGHLWRPTHANTSWEEAKFEVCAQRYLYLDEPGYGVALVNDSTYGHDVRRTKNGPGVSTTARLSLLRAPRFPDPETDQGRHVLHYGLVVGAEPGDAVAEGMKINLPARTVRGQGPVEPLVTIDNPDVLVSAVKLADDGSGDLVVRAYQATGSRSEASIEVAADVQDVQVVDLLERPLTDELKAETGLGKATLRGGAVRVSLRPFQFVTLRYARG